MLHQLEEDGHFISGNVYISPPSDNADASDEDSGDEDGGNVNNLSSNQLLSEATATVFTGSGRVDIGNDTDNEDSSVEQQGEESDAEETIAEEDLPRSKRQKRTSTAAIAPRNEVPGKKKCHKLAPTSAATSTVARKWCKKDLPSSQQTRFEWTVDKPAFLSRDTSPVGMFELFFDDQVIELLCHNTTLYAHQNGRHSFSVTSNEMRCFLAILLRSGYVIMPRRRMYWEQAEDVFSDCVSSAMAKNRFEEILQYFHLADNTHLQPGDKVAKLRPFLSLMNEKFLMFNPCEQKMSIDESMIPYYGHHSCKQFIRGKPIRFGFKMWCLNTSGGYLLQCELYQGAGTVSVDKEVGMTGSVVLDLISELPADRPYLLYFDNLFTSLKLIDHLTKKGIGATGTVRVNRVEKCPLLDVKVMAKKPRGSCDYRLDSSSNTSVIRWNDNSVVTVASNCHGIAPMSSTKRWSSAQSKAINVDQPFAIKAYNTGMGGVDRMDQNISKYRIQMRNKKWWWSIFAYFPDVAVQNSWLLYRMCPSFADRPLDLLQFRREICQV